MKKKFKKGIGRGNHKNHARKHSDKEVIRAIKASNGFLTLAAEKLGLTYQSVSQRMRRKPKIRRIYEALLEKQLDFSESKLLRNIKKGKEASIFFHLKCKGKKRGYVERQEITGAEGGSLKVSLTLEDRLSEIAKRREEEMKKAIQRGEYVGDRSLRTETGERIHGNGGE